MLETNGDIVKMFHPDLERVACKSATAIGDFYNGSSFSKPKPPEITKADLIAYASDKRWRVETGGIVLNGLPVAADDRSKMMLMGARIKAESDATFFTRWKVADGFVDLDAPTIIAISNALLSHVDASFAAENAIVARIGDSLICSVAEIDAADWP